MNKINAKYKLMLFIPLLMITGCKQHEHKNVVIGIGTINKSTVLVLDDVETKKERIYKFSTKPDFYDYLKLGDTVTVTVGYRFSDCRYQNSIVLHQNDVGLRYNADSIYARMQQEKSNKIEKNQNVR